MQVSLFVPCLTDQLFPETGIAAARVLRHLGVEVTYDPDQTCCGQVAFNAGHADEMRELAAAFVERFATAEHVVAPSGSCVAMVRELYADLALPPATRRAWVALRERVHEFTGFLVDVLEAPDLGCRLAARVTYHPSCHLLRELRCDAAPRRLLAAVKDLELIELEDAGGCCGFGGLFAVKFPELSTAMAADKARHIARTGADYVTSTDSSCLMQVGGYLSRQGIQTRPIHIANLLARGLGLEEDGPAARRARS